MITNVLGQILEWFDSEDQELLKAAWQAIFDLMLTPYQELLEREMSTSINTIVPLNKRFYETYRMEYTTSEHTITTLPYLLPVGFNSVKAYGAPSWTSATVTLPVDLGEHATDITTSDDVTIDGTKLLGDGTVDVQYKTTYMGDAEVSDGYVTGPVGVTSITVNSPALTPLNLASTAEVLSDGRLYDPSVNFSAMRLGAKIKLLSGYYDTIIEIIDAHTIKTGPHLPLMTTWVGKSMCYDIEEAFPYTMSTEAVSIPAIGDYREGIDYVIEDGVLAFASDPGTDLLIAYLSFFENDQLSDRFGGIIGYGKPPTMEMLEYHKKLVALWHSIFDVSDKKRMEFLLSAFLGLPYVGPWDGDITIEEIQYDYTVLKPSIDLTFGSDYNTMDVVTTESDYFFSGDKVILLDGGRFLRISEVVTAREAKVEGVIPNGSTVRGATGSYRFDRLIYRSSKGAQVILDIPVSAVPIYKPGEVVPTWSKLFTGIRVRDKVSRSDYVVQDATKFHDEGVTSDLAAVKRMLVANTFLIEVDYETIDLSKLGKVKAAWTQYQEIGRSDFQALGLDDRLVIEAVYAYFFTSSYTATAYLGSPTLINENNCWVNQAQPRVFDGTVTDGTTPGLDFDGTIDIQIPTANKYSVTRNYTIMARIKFDAVSVDQWILTRDGQFRFGMNAASPGELQLQIYDTGAWLPYTSVGAGMVWNQWYTVAAVVHDMDVTFYVDTTYSNAQATTLSAPEVSTNPIYIGYDLVTRLTAEVDYVHMWAVPLTSIEINAFIASGIFPHEDYQIARFDLNTGSGTAAVDTAPSYYGFDKSTSLRNIVWSTTGQQWYAPYNITMAARFCITSGDKGLVLLSSGQSASDSDWEMRLDDTGAGWTIHFLSEGFTYSAVATLSDKVLNQWCSAIISVEGTDAHIIVSRDNDGVEEINEHVLVPAPRYQGGTVASVGTTITASGLTEPVATAIIRDVRAWGIWLTEAEKRDYISGGNPREWDEFLRLPCDETSGTTAEDEAINYMVVI